METRTKALLVFAVFCAAWLIMMAGVALHLCLSDNPTDSYNEFVKWVSSISIVVGAAVIVGAFVFAYKSM